MKPFIKKFSEIGIKDVAEVGGKNASLGEMIRELGPKGVKIPDGFAVTATAYRYFLKNARLADSRHIALETFIKQTLRNLDTKNLSDLARRGKLIRTTIKNTAFPKNLEKEIIAAYVEMEKQYGQNVDVAVRSSATAEDLPGASFAGEHETYLNIRGKEEVLQAVKSAMASLFTDRAISYRADKGFSHLKLALSAGVEKMVRSDLGCSGVMFTLDTESGFKDLILINSSWGLGEMIVQGEVTPDEFLVFKGRLSEPHGENATPRRKSSRNSAFLPIIGKKIGIKNRKMVYSRGRGIKRTRIVNTNEREKKSFTLNEGEILKLAQWGVLIEKHYSRKNKKWTPMDIEWAKDGKTKELYIVQARPETVHAERDFSKVKEYVLESSAHRPITKGASVGSKIASGKARVILDVKKIKQFKAGEILITDMTNPDWEPIMKIASAIVTDKGGRTSHAAIVSRELGIPCVVGTENATQKIKTGQAITVDCSGSEGLIFAGALKFRVIEHDIRKIKKPKTKIAMNIAIPDTAFEKSFLPNEGVGLAREEFIIASDIGIHPMALIAYDNLKNKSSKLKITIKNVKLPQKIIIQIKGRIRGWKTGEQFYIDKLAYGIAKIGAAFYPKEVIVRFSDFKTNEYRALLGGELFEPKEENPMLGWRGASRYYHPDFAPAFILECRAIRKVREEMGLTNVMPMIPFCRTAEEGRKVLAIMEKNGLHRKPQGARRRLLTPSRLAISAKPLNVYVMCEIPSNIVLADEFLKIFDGMSIGSNDLTQLTVGIDRDAGSLIRGIADERDEAVKKLIAEAIQKCRKAKKYVGICGDAPSTFMDFAKFLVEQGIESISLNPDVIVATTKEIYELEKTQIKK